VFTDIINSSTLGTSWTVGPFRSLSRQSDSLVEKWVQLGEICEIVSGQYVNEYVPPDSKDAAVYFRVDSVREFVPNVSERDCEYVSLKNKIQERSRLKDGDIVIARTGTLGKAFIATRSLVGSVLSQHLTRLTLKENCRNILTPEFICLALNSSIGKDQLLGVGSGSTRLEITHERLATVRVPILGREQIERLTASIRESVRNEEKALNLLSEAKMELEALLPECAPKARKKWISIASTELDSLWTASMYAENYIDLERRFSEIFDIKPLNSIAAVFRGKGTRASDYQRTGIPFVRTTSLMNNGLDYFPDHYADVETYRSYRQETQDGDILVSIEGKIGCVAILQADWPVVFKNHVECIRLYDSAGVDPYFLYLLFLTKQYQGLFKRRTVVQATIPGMASRLRSIPIIVGRKSGEKSFSHDAERLSKKAKIAARLRLTAYHELHQAKELLEAKLGV